LAENLELILAEHVTLDSVQKLTDEDLSDNLHADFPPETLASWRARLDEIRHRPCPATNEPAPDEEDFLGDITPPRDLLQPW
jgi:hypothetical protein